MIWGTICLSDAVVVREGTCELLVGVICVGYGEDKESKPMLGSLVSAEKINLSLRSCNLSKRSRYG